MASVPDDGRIDGAERFQPDRRSDEDRRVVQAAGSVDNRRAGRRRITTRPFAPADAATVDGMVSSATSAVSCPACQGNLMLGPPMERGGIVARRVECIDCHRVAMVQAKR